MVGLFFNGYPQSMGAVRKKFDWVYLNLANMTKVIRIYTVVFSEKVLMPYVIGTLLKILFV